LGLAFDVALGLASDVALGLDFDVVFDVDFLFFIGLALNFLPLATRNRGLSDEGKSW
jgi:hypothetical protein